MIQQWYVEQLVLWSHKTYLMGNPFPYCPMAPQFLWHIPMTHKKRQVQISFDQGTEQWTMVWTCSEEIIIPSKQRLPRKFLADFLVFDTFPINPFEHFLTCYRNKDIPFFEGSVLLWPGKCQNWGELTTHWKISPHILKSFLQGGANVGLNAGSLLSFPSKHLIHWGVGVGSAHGRVQRGGFWGKREWKRDIQDYNELLSFLDPF